MELALLYILNDKLICIERNKIKMRKKIVKVMLIGMTSAMLFGCSKKAAETTAPKDNGSVSTEAKGSDDTKMVDSIETLGSEDFVRGTVKEFQGSSIVLERTDQEKSSEDNTIVLNVTSSGFYILDAETGKASLDLKNGDEIVAFISKEQTLSLPPQVNTYAFLTNVKDAVLPQFTNSIESVNESGNETTLKDTANNVEWSFDKGVKPIFISTESEGSFKDIKKGDKCLIWSNPVAVNKDNQSEILKADKIVVLK